MTDLEQAYLTGPQIIECMRRDGGKVPSDGHYYAKLIDFALAAARREGAEEARKQAEAVMEAFAHRMKQTGAEEMRERAVTALREAERVVAAAIVRALPLTPEEPT